MYDSFISDKEFGDSEEHKCEPLSAAFASLLVLFNSSGNTTKYKRY
jgi:hypothetical protein